MAKKIRLPLKMKNGVEVRSLEELRENFDLESVLGYFTDGKLKTWLADRYYDEKAEAVASISADMPDLNAKLCEILEVEYHAEENVADLEDIQRRNEKLRILREVTADKDILDNIDIVAMDQDELFDILDNYPQKVYLYGEKYEIPFSRNNICYIGINRPTIVLEKNKHIFDYESNNITFINTEYENTLNPYVTKGEMLFLKGNFKEAYPLIKESAENGNPRAMYLMARYCSNGYETVVIDTDKRDEWCRKAFPYNEPISMYGYAQFCVNDELEKQNIYYDIFLKINEMACNEDSMAQSILGQMYIYGNGVTKDISEAYELLTKASEQGNIIALNYLGNWNIDGDKGFKNYTGAFECYKKTAEKGDAIAQFVLGKMYYDGKVGSSNYAEAVKWYTKAAEQNCTEAQVRLGYMYIKGEGLTQDYAESMKWFKRAAEQGNANAQCNLGIMYKNGDGVPRNYAGAIKWFKLAADQGNDNAQYNLGLMYVDGNGVSCNYTEAAKWYRLAAEQGNSDAQYNLGLMYKKGDGISRNYTEAIKWYTKAAEQGDADAQFALANMYLYGEGIERNHDEAIKWYKKAAENGNEAAKNRLITLNRLPGGLYGSLDSAFIKPIKSSECIKPRKRGDK